MKSGDAGQLWQAIRAGIAAVLALYVARLVRLPESYWAPISAIIVTYSNVGKTISASWTRLIGTAIGVTMGSIFTAYSVLACGSLASRSRLQCCFAPCWDSRMRHVWPG